MPILRADIIEDTLRDLTVLGVGDSAPSAEDAAEVGKRLDALFAELRVMGLNADDAGVWDLDDVPPHYRTHLTKITMNRCADLFQVPEDRIVRINLQAENAENEIRRLAMPVNTGGRAQAEYF